MRGAVERTAPTEGSLAHRLLLAPRSERKPAGGIRPQDRVVVRFRPVPAHPTNVGALGLEPKTSGLKGPCSTVELRPRGFGAAPLGRGRPGAWRGYSMSSADFLSTSSLTLPS